MTVDAIRITPNFAQLWSDEEPAVPSTPDANTTNTTSSENATVLPDEAATSCIDDTEIKNETSANVDTEGGQEVASGGAECVTADGEDSKKVEPVQI
jgi:hypothetical protein